MKKTRTIEWPEEVKWAGPELNELPVNVDTTVDLVWDTVQQPLSQPPVEPATWVNTHTTEYGVGGRTNFGKPAGFVKHDEDKPMFDLIPPEVELEVAKAFTHGARKYSANNYRKGTRWGRYIAATRRHLNAWQLGEDLDPDSGLSHLAHALASLMMLRVLQLSNAGEDDRT